MGLCVDTCAAMLICVEKMDVSSLVLMTSRRSITALKPQLSNLAMVTPPQAMKNGLQTFSKDQKKPVDTIYMAFRDNLKILKDFTAINIISHGPQILSGIFVVEVVSVPIHTGAIAPPTEGLNLSKIQPIKPIYHRLYSTCNNIVRQ